MGPVLPGAASDCALPAESGSVGGTGADPTPACTAGAALSHIILCLDCIWTTTSCDRGKDFCPDRQHLLARSRGCRRSWNTSRQNRPERTYEAQITPARRVGTRTGAQPSPLRVITLRTTHLPQHHCRRPPAIPRRRGITRAVEDTLKGGPCPNRRQRSPTTFRRATRTAESCGFFKRTQRLQPPLSPIWTLPTVPRPSARPGRPDARRHPSS